MNERNHKSYKNTHSLSSLSFDNFFKGDFKIVAFRSHAQVKRIMYIVVLHEFTNLMTMMIIMRKS